MTAQRMVETPEGVAIVVELADLGSRAVALLIDLLVIFCGVALTALFFTWVFALAFGSELATAMWHLAFFFFRGPYFLFFELRWRGQTPGKRLLGLRVVDRRGGALSASGLAARNLMREVEVFLPLTLLANVGSGEPMFLAALVWVGVFALLPMFDRDRLRLGDMIGGTWVIAVPPLALGEDLTARDAAGEFHFAKAQLDRYGIAELQVLEQVLRGSKETAAGRETRREVARRICRRIGAEEPVDRRGVDAFLAAYYAALREHLERLALFGERRVDKRATESGSIEHSR